MSDVRHSPLQPSWKCVACSQPWPCRVRRETFLADYEGRRSQLRATLGAFLISASEDLTEPIEQLHTRFVAWSYRR